MIKRFKGWKICILQTYSRVCNQTKMSTQCTSPRELSYPHFWKTLERSHLLDSLCILLLSNMLILAPPSRKFLGRKRFFRRLLYLFCFLACTQPMWTSKFIANVSRTSILLIPNGDANLHWISTFSILIGACGEWPFLLVFGNLIA